MSRRLANEAIRDNWEELEIHHFIEEKTIYIQVEDENLLTIDYKSTYPFRPPSVTYNCENILIFYRELSDCPTIKIRDDISKLLGDNGCNGCMCCSTLLCGYNWSIHNTIKNILEEFDKFCNIKKRSVERFWSDRIASRFLVEDIPLREYL
uniref:RWD domain-containing protein n=1 Tax=viral metagenome TaxID=1070528 RepID=A0A6C0ENV1_9ZZZZ